MTPERDLAARRGQTETVYQPAEDSRLLATAAIEHLGPDDRVVEVGTGSGYVAATIAQETGADVIGTDLNPDACEQTRERGVEALRANLLDPFAADSFDAVVCNPPYLPTEPDEERSDWMEVALSGGESGLAVIEPLLADVGRALRPDGVVLLLVSSLTGVDDVVELASAAGFSAAAVAEDSFPFETLSVLKLVR
ncbi:methyltransferase [Salinarchaeum sp. Harcht-Bsk1]|uniref:HemK2/MTQ2 family protein methyltransferase n=1 Tax=Salinarchaeum sp. Harcht-Bsk1 TaxID=1333523 RepID=UPI0003423F41|nr:HemK2/MTQ2 family protein methyltransferase [Salinarchaeum sp. Harcht-Bsk1]AGN00230.1 methyltransferase [Salinarchaeum sp. Harcht-Bsk1]